MPEQMKQIEKIKGQQLTVVSFVQDYVRLEFARFWIDAFAAPLLIVENSGINYGEPNYCDNLVKCIGATIEEITFKDQERIVLTLKLSNSVSMIIATTKQHGPPPEEIIFGHASEGILEIW